MPGFVPGIHDFLSLKAKKPTTSVSF